MLHPFFSFDDPRGSLLTPVLSFEMRRANRADTRDAAEVVGAATVTGRGAGGAVPTMLLNVA